MRPIDAIAAERKEWVARRLSEESRLESIWHTHPVPRSRKADDIAREAFFIWWGVLAIGCVLIITGGYGKSLFSWVIAFGLAIVTAGWYQTHQQKEAQSIIDEEMQENKVELEKRNEDKKTERERKSRERIERQASRRFSRYERIVEAANRKNILLHEYVLYTYPPDWDVRAEIVKKRDQYRCRDCSSISSILHVHHITRVGAGGTHHLSNLVTLCPKCHLDKHPSKRPG